MEHKLYRILLFVFGTTILFSCENDDINKNSGSEIIIISELKEAVEMYSPNKFQNGYTLIAPLTSKNTYLIDMEGYIVNRWTSEYTPNNSVYLLEDGSLLRTEKTGNNPVFSGDRGHGGRIAKYSFDGQLTWAWNYSSDQFCQHHDIEVMPNGNILVIAWEIKTDQEAHEIGKNPEYINPKGVWPEHIIEIEPMGASSAKIVWEWHQWDHIIQDFDEEKDNFGNVTSHPELIDINFSQSIDMDITHFNSIDYIEEHDLIVLSAHHYSELWFIDHSTTTAESATHEGGKRGKGGDLVYRWGNPQAYKNGLPSEQLSFLQHDAVWLDGLPSNGGNLMFFNNGDAIIDRAYSTVDEIMLPIDENGNFELAANATNGPISVEWRFQQDDFFSNVISGAQRLKNGNTLICEGMKGMLHEVTTDKETVWKYNLPLPKKTIFRAYRYPKDYPAFSGKLINRMEIDME